jgi:ankyrin repeat protein
VLFRVARVDTILFLTSNSRYLSQQQSSLFSADWNHPNLTMAKRRSKPIHQRELPQYAYALAILSGGLAYVISQLVRPTTSWLTYAFLAALFASVWPYKALQWAVWMCLPAALLICFDVVATGNLTGVLLGSGMTFAKSLSCTCLGAYLGAKIPLGGVAHRRRLKSRNNDSQNSSMSKKASASNINVAAEASSRNNKTFLPSLETTAQLNSLNVALMKASQEGDLERVKLLMAEGADVNGQSKNGWTPFAIAGEDFDLEMFKTIFGKGSSTVASNRHGWTPLIVATISGHEEIVRALLARGAEVNAGNDEGWTALRFAVSMDETEILRLLLNAGADANRRDHEGQTALMQAARENSLESLKILLESGADALVEDRNQQTALKVAEAYGHTEIISLLKESEAKVSHSIEDASRNVWRRPARLLLLAAVFHLLLVVTIFLLGRDSAFTDTFDSNGIGISFAADGIEYREDAARLSETLKRGELLDWLSSRDSLQVKLYSIGFALFGSLFGQNIISIEPLNCLYYLMILVLVFQIGSEAFNRRVGLVSATTVALWPSFLLHTTQMLRDPLFVMGTLALFLILLRLACARIYSWPKALLAGGCGGLTFVILWIARSNMGEILIATVLVGALMLIARQFATGERIQLANLCGMTLLVALTIGAPQVLPNYYQPIYAQPSVTAEAQMGTLPTVSARETARTAHAEAQSQSVWSRLVAEVSAARRRFIWRYPNAGSNLDANVQLVTTTDLIHYFPRAALIGFFAPFPNMWFTKGTQVGLSGKMLAGIETFIIYIVEAFALYALWQRRRQLSAWFLFLTAATGILALGFVVVNIGALFRLRYLFLMLLIILGVDGVLKAFDRFSKRLAIVNEP